MTSLAWWDHALTGVVIGFALAKISDFIGRRRRKGAHLASISAEIEICHRYAQPFQKAKVMAPLYRLPHLTYSTSLPELLSIGALRSDKARALTEFFTQVQTLNRGLDQADSARDDTRRFQDEYIRNRLKAKELVEQFYPSAREAVFCKWWWPWG